MKKIDISFGAFDSELYYQEINIPNGFEATIKDNKVILKKKESEDEKVRAALIELVKYKERNGYTIINDVSTSSMKSWIEKQGQTFTKKDVDDAYIEGMAFAKNELEKQCELKPILDIEIPFGAMDSELIESTYFIPKGFHAEIIGDKVHIKQGEQNPSGYENVNIQQKDFAPKIELKDYKDIDPHFFKNADNVEPKFHEGDWIIGNEGIFKITRYEDEYGYELIGTTGYVAHFISPDYLESNYHLWTIQDAKDGDVLCYKDEVFLYKHDIINCTKKETSFGGMVYYCCYDCKRFITDSMYSLTEKDKDDIYPATKEQRDLLFQKMKEVGYEWDAENKKLIEFHI